MKANNINSVLAIALCILACFNAGCLFDSDWERDVVKNGIAFDKVTQRESGIWTGVLKENTQIQGYPCQKGWVGFNGDWTLRRFTLSEPFDIGHDTILPKDTYVVSLWQGGRIRVCALPGRMKIQGQRCIGTGGPKGVQVSFYPDGALQTFFAPQDTDIQGVPCRGGVFHIIQLHPNGSIKQATLPVDTRINDIIYPKGKTLYFNETGQIVEKGQ